MKLYETIKSKKRGKRDTTSSALQSFDTAELENNGEEENKKLETVKESSLPNSEPRFVDTNAVKENLISQIKHLQFLGKKLDAKINIPIHSSNVVTADDLSESFIKKNQNMVDQPLIRISKTSNVMGKTRSTTNYPSPNRTVQIRKKAFTQKNRYKSANDIDSFYPNITIKVPPRSFVNATQNTSTISSRNTSRGKNLMQNPQENAAKRPVDTLVPEKTDWADIHPVLESNSPTKSFLGNTVPILNTEMETATASSNLTPDRDAYNGPIPRPPTNPAYGSTQMTYENTNANTHMAAKGFGKFYWIIIINVSFGRWKYRQTQVCLKIKRNRIKLGQVLNRRFSDHIF